MWYSQTHAAAFPVILVAKSNVMSPTELNGQRRAQQDSLRYRVRSQASHCHTMSTLRPGQEDGSYMRAF